MLKLQNILIFAFLNDLIYYYFIEIYCKKSILTNCIYSKIYIQLQTKHSRRTLNK